MKDVSQLAQQAGQLAGSGRWDEAEQVWLEVRRREPKHAQALFSLAVHALKRGDSAAAVELLLAARELAPRDRLILMTLCAARQHQGDAQGEREAIDAALELDPYYLPALLAKAGWLERCAHPCAAANAYRNCLQVAPPESSWPADMRARLGHAARVVAKHVDDYGGFLERRLSDLQAALPVSRAERWREACSIFSGRTKPYRSESNQLHVPRLPATPFFERGRFEWTAALEASTAAIRDELLAVMRDARDSLKPYVAYGPGDPVNQWQDLNHSDRWSTLHLWRAGQPVVENLGLCPETARVLERVKMAEIAGLCPNAMFSVLAPRTRIPPHHGETNARLVAHLPLVVPPGCSFRVGFERREWRVGELLVFDDTIEHEAHNDSDEPRAVLIFDVWNVLLESAERDLVQAMAAAAREYSGADAPAVPAGAVNAGA